jgi:tetratricopeptide (TPR) repeat protein
MTAPGELTPSLLPAHGAAASQRLPLWPALFAGLLGFLLASSPARNSDVWLHLAAGRQLLAAGSTEALSGARPTWLYDLLTYGLYQAVGGAGLVLCKALLVAGLALLLLRLSQAGAAWGLAAACTALALLAMGTSLLVRPATVSYFLLVLTLWLLRPSTEAAARQPSLLPPWPLLAVFVAWANLDPSFVVGLGTVALVWLGQLLDLARQGDRETRRQGDKETGRLGARTRFSFLVSVSPCLLVSLSLLAAACLLNPAHVYAFTLPPELARRVGPSLFDGAYWTRLGLIPAGLAFLPLLGLSLLSFLVNLPRWHWQRFLPWLGLALLSAWQPRAGPYFAVVAGPVLAWNLGEWSAAREMRPRALRALRPLGVIAAFALLVCAWPGWLQAPPFEPRRWVFETPPSLERGAAATRRWHQEGKLGPAARGLHLSAETAHAFAWFCPEENGVRDDRLAATIRGSAQGAADWDQRMRAAGINHLIVYDSDGGRLFSGLERLLADPWQWPLLYLEGNLAVFGWRDPGAINPKSADPFRGLELDVAGLALRPAVDKRAPRARPEREPEPRRWWEAFYKPAPPWPIDRDEAALFLLFAQAARPAVAHRNLVAWQAGQTAGLLAAAGSGMTPCGLLDAPFRLVLLQPQSPQVGMPSALDQLAVALRRGYFYHQDESPPAPLYLAVRASRRALAVNPEDAHTYLILGECYLRLLHNTRERVWGTHLKHLVQLRHTQASAALNQALALQPDLALAHFNLGYLYRKMGYLDLALHHLRAHQKLTHDAGPPPGGSAEQFRTQEVLYDEELGRLATTVSAAERKYAAEAGRLRVLDRALLAREQGLAGKARDLLLESTEAAFGWQGTAMELELLLHTGRVQEVRQWTLDLSPKQKAQLGLPAYHWLRARALAASGDYALAEEELAQMATGGRPPGSGTPALLIAAAVGEEIISEQPGGGCFCSRLARVAAGMDLRSGVTGLAWRMREEADATVLRGLLSLEEGWISAAAAAFRVALVLWQDEAAAATGAGLDFDGRPLAQGFLEWLEAKEQEGR